MRSDAGDEVDDGLLAGIGPALSRLRRHAPGGRKDFSRNLVLNVVAESEGEVTVGAIADELRIDASVASRMISDAIKEGLLARAASQSDARRTVLRITPAGDRLRLEFARQQQRAFEQITREWHSNDRMTFAKLLIRYAADSASFRAASDVPAPDERDPRG